MAAYAAVFCLMLAMLCGCSTSSSKSAAPDINPSCPVSFTIGGCGCTAPCCGLALDAGDPTPPYMCQPVPSGCDDNLTCDCIGSALCQTQDGFDCSYDAGTFTVGCINN